MKIRILALGILAAMLVTINSCQKSNTVTDNAVVSQEIQNRILALGFSPEGAVATDGGYIVENDIFLSKEDIEQGTLNLQNSIQVGDEEQYRTTNLVTGLPRVIKVSISSQLPASYVNALDVAISRYNAENLQLTFQRVSSGANIAITKATGNYLASSGFPSGGNPYNSIKVNSNAIGNGSTSTFYNYVGSILAHEIGHCIGFRHTDYMNRAYSCGGTPVNEGDGGVGAILIPGTPSNPDPNSWMLACISNLQNRPFNANDKVALNYLY
jgi:predicted Zn-dependent protease